MGYYLAWTDKLGGRMATKFKNIEKANIEFKYRAKRVREIALFHDVRGFHSTTQLEYLILWSSPEGKCYWGNGLTSLYTTENEKSEIRSKRYFVPI